jgi:hypothetical protein
VVDHLSSFRLRFLLFCVYWRRCDGLYVSFVCYVVHSCSVYKNQASVSGGRLVGSRCMDGVVVR